MGWEREYEHWRDMGHTWGPGIDDYEEPTEEEALEYKARFAAYEKELSVIRVQPRQRWVDKGADLEADIPELKELSKHSSPYNWRERLSAAKIQACKEAAEEMGYSFGVRTGAEDKDKFLVKVEFYGDLPGCGGNIHPFVASGIDNPNDCLQLVADFRAIGKHTTTFYKGYHISEDNTARLLKEMERWGVSFDLKDTVGKEIKQLAVELDQFAYDFDTYAYKDVLSDREQSVAALEKSIANGTTKHIKNWLQSITLAENDVEVVLESKTLMKWLERVEKKIIKEKGSSLDEKMAEAKKQLGEEMINNNDLRIEKDSINKER